MTTKETVVVLALDVGSSSARCSAYRVVPSQVVGGGAGEEEETPATTTSVVAIPGSSSSRPLRSVQPTTGKILLSSGILDAIDECVDDVLRCLRGTIGGGGDNTWRVAGIGFSTFVMNLVGVDENGVPLGDDFTLSYACNDADVASECVALRHELGPRALDELYRRTGAPLHGAYALAQLRVLYRGGGGASSSPSTPFHRTRRRQGEEEVSVSSGVDPDTEEEATAAPLPVHKWLTVASVCLSRWTGRKADVPVSYSEASWTGLFDFRSCTWDKGALSLLPDKCQAALPDLADYCSIDGGDGGDVIHVRDRIIVATKNDGIDEEVMNPYWDRWPELRGSRWVEGNKFDEKRPSCRLFLGIGDGACANLGSKCSDRSRLAVTIGTSAAARVSVPLPMHPRVDHDRISGRANEADVDIPRGLFCYRIDKHRVLIGGALTDGGSVVEWARSFLNLRSDDEFDACMDNAARLYREEGGDVVGTGPSESTLRPRPSGDALTVVPFLGGERSTGFRDGARGCVSGLMRDTTPAHFLKACLEGVVLRIDAIISLIEQVLHAADGAACGHSQSLSPSSREDLCIVASGNALERNALWRQMLADCSGIPVVVDGQVSEGTSRGAALLVARALFVRDGEFEPESSSCQRSEALAVVKQSTRVLPGMASKWKTMASTQEEIIDAVCPLWCSSSGTQRRHQKLEDDTLEDQEQKT